MASRAKFPVYRGEKPYIFVSYAHVDSETVLPIAEELHKRGYRVWYDEGIEAGRALGGIHRDASGGRGCSFIFPFRAFQHKPQLRARGQLCR